MARSSPHSKSNLLIRSGSFKLIARRVMEAGHNLIQPALGIQNVNEISGQYYNILERFENQPDPREWHSQTGGSGSTIDNEGGESGGSTVAAPTCKEEGGGLAHDGWWMDGEMTIIGRPQGFVYSFPIAQTTSRCNDKFQNVINGYSVVESTTMADLMESISLFRFSL
ncbi:hypothetical protein OUZ56_030835 [Daphnia magna]|uniref:Uncharacterized protein n=1 Tax=Daphnia magna TaxID=35525 RepID=A0ABQ9ZT03_9CRUS|nr:hypothetical protein OUZ56_030835 [Daphnia magna]